MATVSDNDFAEVTDEMILEKLKMWAIESFPTYLSLRNKSPEWDFEILVCSLVIFYQSGNFVLLCFA